MSAAEGGAAAAAGERVAELEGQLNVPRSSEATLQAAATQLQKQAAKATGLAQAKASECAQLQLQLDTAGQSEAADAGAMKAEYERVTEERDRASNQLQKLQEHLIHSEAQHTNDAVAMDSQIKQLSAALEDARQDKGAAEARATAATTGTEARIRALEAEAASAVTERDKYQTELVKAVSDKDKMAIGLSNLELVLQGFEAEKEAHVQAVQSEAGTSSRALQADAEVAHARVVELEAAAASARAELETLSGVQTELNIARGMHKSLESDNARLQADLSKHQAELADRMASISERLIDKKVIANMFVSFCEQSGDHKQQVLGLICNALGLSEADRYSCGIRQPRGFFTSLMSGPAAVAETPDRQQGASRSFAQDLVDFMMTEADADPTTGGVGVGVGVGGASTGGSLNTTPNRAAFPAANPMSGLKPPSALTSTPRPGDSDSAAGGSARGTSPRLSSSNSGHFI